jgi:alkylation response protein AidB-like acyl-CoA dehydrogenase
MLDSQNKEMKMLEKAAAEFAKKELISDRKENDTYPFGPFFSSVLKNAFDVDFFHITLPEEIGGIGQKISALCIILNSICQEDASLGNIIFTNTFAQEIILAAQESAYLEKLCKKALKPEDFLIAYPVFNNPVEIKHTARAQKSGKNYILSGPLEYIVLGGIADQGLIPAEIKDEPGISFFIVDLHQSEVIKSDPVLSLGLHACPAVDVEFKGAAAIKIGQSGSGKEYFETARDKMNVAAASMSCGIMQGSFNEALEYSKNRMQGGRKIINWSELQMLLAGMAISIKISDMILSQACKAQDIKKKTWEQCALAAAIHIQKAACDLTTDGIQVLGGVGYMKDFGQEKRFRDAKQLQALMGLAPLKKINYLKKLIGLI